MKVHCPIRQMLAINRVRWDWERRDKGSSRGGPASSGKTPRESPVMKTGHPQRGAYGIMRVKQEPVLSPPQAKPRTTSPGVGDWEYPKPTTEDEAWLAIDEMHSPSSNTLWSVFGAKMSRTPPKLAKVIELDRDFVFPESRERIQDGID